VRNVDPEQRYKTVKAKVREVHRRVRLLVDESMVVEMRHDRTATAVVHEERK
jgi:hypothetical protein